MHDARPKDTIRDAFEAMLAFLTILIGGPMPRSWPDIATAAAKGLGSQARTTEEAERAVAAIAALRDLIQRAAEEHSRRALPLPPFALTDSPPVDREALGRIVREVWIAWAKEQPAPKPSWLVPWEGLSEPDREVDRRIGERIAQTVLAVPVAATGADAWPPARIAEALERCERATPGPWGWTPGSGDAEDADECACVQSADGSMEIEAGDKEPSFFRDADAAFIAAARADLPSALRALATAQGRLAETLDEARESTNTIADLRAEVAALAAKLETMIGATPAAAPTFYIQDTRSYVGNAVLWWRPEGAGYTTNIDDAGQYSEAEARRICRARSSEKMVPAAAVRAAMTRVVDADALHTALAKLDAPRST